MWLLRILTTVKLKKILPDVFLTNATILNRMKITLSMIRMIIVIILFVIEVGILIFWCLINSHDQL